MRRRGAKLEDALLDAAWRVLAQHGYSGFTYEAVAARANTSRAVLYRRWPQRDKLMLATLRKLFHAHPIVVPDTGSLRGDALAFLRNAATGRARMVTLLNLQLMEYFRDSGTNARELRDALRLGRTRSAFAQIVARAVERGELAKAKRSARIVELPFDLYRYEVFMTMRAVPAKTIVSIVDEVWLPLLGVRKTR